MSTKKIDPSGAQPTDPPWARLLFLLVQGREGQWWRAILLAVPLLLLVIAIAGLVGMLMITALLPLGAWVSSAIGVGSLTAGGAVALCRRRHKATSRRINHLTRTSTDPIVEPPARRPISRVVPGRRRSRRGAGGFLR